MATNTPHAANPPKIDPPLSDQTGEELFDALVRTLSEPTGAWLHRAIEIHAELGARGAGLDALGSDAFAQAMSSVSALVQAATTEMAEHAGTERARKIFIGGIGLLAGLAGVFRADTHPAQYAAACGFIADFRDAGKNFAPGAGVGPE
jgi:hypothetical protein